MSCCWFMCTITLAIVQLYICIHFYNMQERCSVWQCSLTQYTGSISLFELTNCNFNTSDRETYAQSSVCIHSDLNQATQESVALHVFHELKLFNASQECVAGFKPWICRQLFTSCANYCSNTGREECEIFSSLCAEDADLIMTSALLVDVCFFSSPESGISSGNGKHLHVLP